MKVVIIGTGNVAGVLGKKINEAGHSIVEIVGRNKTAVSKLAKDFEAKPTFSINTITTLADIYIIAVTDYAIQQIADELRVNDKLVVHTAASKPMNILSECSDRYGVLYPLQTLKNGLETIPPIPVLIDGDDESTREILKDFCSSWAHSVAVANDQQRLKVHVSAVFLNNFTNHLFAITKKYCDDYKIDFELFQPLIQQTFATISEHNPIDVQTGPARRNDLETIEKHRSLLAENPSMLLLFNQITQSIINFYK